MANNTPKAPPPEALSPVHLFSHGSTMMLGEDSASARYWERCGEEALAHGIEHVVMMVPTPLPLRLPEDELTLFQGAHWATSLPGGNLISANPKPDKSPVALVHPSKYKPYVLNPDIDYVPVLQERFRAVGIPCEADPTFDCTAPIPMKKGQGS